MIHEPIDVLEQFPVRKSKKQKAAFRDAVQEYVKTMGYDCRIEKGSLGSRNVVIGDPERAKYLITAHYDTCARMLIPNLITPCNFFTFILYQLFVVLILFVPAIGLGMLIDYFVDIPGIGRIVYGLVLIVSIVLMMIGPANKHNANDNTSGVVTALEIAKTLPENLRNKVCFVLFDLEEAGLIGSASHRNMHKKASQNQVVLNLDCVGDGDDILFFLTKKMKNSDVHCNWLSRCAGTYGQKNIKVRRNGFSVYPSDQAKFPYGVGIAALRQSRFGLYLGKIHTKRDTILEMANVNILRDSLIGLISTDAVQ